MATMKKQKRMQELKELLKRDHTLSGGVLFGLDGHVIELQARAIEVMSSPRSWRSNVRITGMARGAVYEALDRVSGAFAKLGIPEPEVEILINLAPADLPKEGTWLDLPLAIIMLQAAGILPDLPEEIEDDFILLGELSLHGEVRRVPGVLSMAYISHPGQALIVPKGNELECALIMAAPGHEKCKVCAVSTLAEVIEFFKGKQTLDNVLSQKLNFDTYIAKSVDFGRVRGQDRAKRAATIAAAGGHNLLLIGPPGEGKSLIAKALPGILPRLSNPEKVELTRIYSACGELDRDGLVVTRRPMRPVHHTVSKQALVGGGSGVPRPGEITLAHLGILFLDELAEFSQSSIDALRQPMEDGEIHISRVHATLTYPAQFTLVAATNPCPCGFFGSDLCRCTDHDVKKYQRKISGPILDRIDLQVELERLSTEERFEDGADGESKQIRARVELARDRQLKRFDGKGVAFNAAIPGGYVRDYCNFSDAAMSRYRQLVDENVLSTRSMDRLGKVARTIADLNDEDQLGPEHVDEADTFVVGGMLRDAFIT